MLNKCSFSVPFVEMPYVPVCVSSNRENLCVCVYIYMYIHTIILIFFLQESLL